MPSLGSVVVLSAFLSRPGAAGEDKEADPWDFRSAARELQEEFGKFRDEVKAEVRASAHAYGSNASGERCGGLSAPAPLSAEAPLRPLAPALRAHPPVPGKE